MAEKLCVVVVVWVEDGRAEASAPLALLDAMRLLQQLRDSWGVEAFTLARIVPLDSLGSFPGL